VKENECRLVATLLDDYSNIHLVDSITPDMFTDSTARKIYIAMLELSEDGEPVEVIGVAQKAGLSNYDLTTFLDAYFPYSAMVKHDCAEILTAWQAVQLSRIQRTEYTGTPDEKASAIKKDIDDILDYSDYGGGYDDSILIWSERYQAWYDGKIIRGILTGYGFIDKCLRYMPGSLVTIGARTSVGKSTFAINQALNIAKAGDMVGLISLEMSKIELVDKMLGSVYGIRNIYSGSAFSDTVSKAQELNGLKIKIHTPGTTDSVKVMNIIRRMRSQGCAVVFVDYLQLMSHPDRAQNRNYEIGRMTQALKALAVELEITIVILSQLKRKDGNPFPILSDLRDSGSIEQDSNIVIFLHDNEPEKHEEFVTLECAIAKNRGGPTGYGKILFDKPISRMLEEDTFHE